MVCETIMIDTEYFETMFPIPNTKRRDCLNNDGMFRIPGSREGHNKFYKKNKAALKEYQEYILNKERNSALLEKYENK